MALEPSHIDIDRLLARLRDDQRQSEAMRVRIQRLMDDLQRTLAAASESKSWLPRSVIDTDFTRSRKRS